MSIATSKNGKRGRGLFGRRKKRDNAGTAVPPRAASDVDEGDPRLEHGLPFHHPGAVQGTEVVAYHNDMPHPSDTGRTHEKAVAYGATQGNGAAKSDDAGEAVKNAADVERGIEESATMQGSFRAEKIMAGAIDSIQPEVEKTVEPRNKVELLESKAASYTDEANRVRKDRLIPAEKARDAIEKARDDLPWMSKLVGHLLFALVVAAVTTVCFDAVVVSIAASFLPIDGWAGWAFSILTGLGIITAVTGLSFLWATVLGSEDHDRLWRRPPAGLFVAACAITLAVGGLLGIGFWQLADYRAEAIDRLAHGLAIDPQFVLPLQSALTVSAVIIETITIVCLKGKVLAKELEKKEGLISATRGLVETLENQAHRLMETAAELKDDAAGMAQARIDGILLAADAKASAAIAQGESAAAAAYSAFWNSFDAAWHGLVTFQTEGDTGGLLERLSEYRRGLLLTIAGLAATLFAGVTGWALAGPLAGVSAALGAGSFTAFRGGMDPHARSSLRRMARKSEIRASGVIGGFSLAALAGFWALLGPVPGVAAALITAAVLGYRAYGGAQPADSVDPAVEGRQRSQVIVTDPMVRVIGREAAGEWPTVGIPIPPKDDEPTHSTNGSNGAS